MAALNYAKKSNGGAPVKQRHARLITNKLMQLRGTGAAFVRYPFLQAKDKVNYFLKFGIRHFAFLRCHWHLAPDAGSTLCYFLEELGFSLFVTFVLCGHLLKGGTYTYGC